MSLQEPYYRPQARSPRRKPVGSAGSDQLRPLTKITPDSPPLHSGNTYPTSPPQQPSSYRQSLSAATTDSSHTRSRTASSGTLPGTMNHTQPYVTATPGNPPMPYQQWAMNQQNPPARRTLSNATTSTSSTGGPTRKPSSSSSTLHRSTSNRSGSSPSSYVALMRKQKATVWSDRAQHEDVRLLAAQRAAKARAAMEVAGTSANMGRNPNLGTSSLTGGVRSKIRHHGAPKAQQYAPTANPASGVPMRLSAREIEEDDSEDDYANRINHHRSGSGRSSLGSAGRVASAYGMHGAGVATGRSSEASTPPPTQTRAYSNAGTAESRLRGDTTASAGSGTEQKTPMADHFRSVDYFSKPGAKKEATSANSLGSENSSDRETGFGGVGGLPKRVKDEIDEQQRMDDLQRRGSVDERTTTMRGYGKLFVANPDLSD